MKEESRMENDSAITTEIFLSPSQPIESLTAAAARGLEALREPVRRDAPAGLSAEIIEKVLLSGDLAKLTPQERVNYYGRVCDSIGLNPLTRPFEYLTLNGKLTLYAKRDATDQLRSLRKVSIEIVSREKVGDVYAVTARASTPDGRRDESIGAVTAGTLKGDPLANAIMKAETKAKRRVTLSIVGLGWLDETEIETIPGARVEEPPEKPPNLGLVPQQSRAEGESHDPVWDDADAPVPEPEIDHVPAFTSKSQLSDTKRELVAELEAWPADKRDDVIRSCSMIREDDGSPSLKHGKPIAVESLQKMLSEKISDRWAGATLGKIRAMKQRIAAERGVA